MFFEYCTKLGKIREQTSKGLEGTEETEFIMGLTLPQPCDSFSLIARSSDARS